MKGPSRTGWFWFAVVGFAAFVAFASLTSGSEAPPRPPGASADDSGPDGLSRWAALAEHFGYDTSIDQSTPAEADLDRDTTAILLDPGPIDRAEALALRSFVLSGGRLIIGGLIDRDALYTLLADDTSRARTVAASAHRLLPSSEVGAITAISPVESWWARLGPELPLIGSASGPWLVVRSLGEGELLLPADAGPFTNARIAEPDSRILAVSLLGSGEQGDGQRVVFLDDLGPIGGPTAIAALPDDWGWAVGLLIAATLLLAWAQAVRFGPPSPSGRALPPPRGAYIEALSSALVRARSGPEVAESLREAALDRLDPLRGALDRPDSARVALAAERAGISAAELQSLQHPLTSNQDAINAQRALTKLWR